MPFYQFNYTDKDKGVNAEAYFNISDTGDDATVLDTFLLAGNGSLMIKQKLDSALKEKYSV